MFGKSKKEENRFIIAIKNYTDTLKSMKDGSLYLPYNKEIYFNLIESQGSKVDNLKELGKFIKKSNLQKNEVKHFWECLISQGYTLISVKYAEKTPPLESLCDNSSFKYVCKL